MKKPGSSLKIKKQGGDFSHPDDKKYARWRGFSQWPSVVFHWPKKQALQAGKVSHDKEGKATLNLQVLKSGFYRLVYETKDRFGAKFKTQKDFLVVGKKNRINFPLIAASSKHSYKPGETFKLIVHSGFEKQKVHYTFRRKNEILKQGFVYSGSGFDTIELPITEKLRGGFSYAVHALNDYQMNQIQGSVSVPWTNKQLQVEFESFRDRLRPGSKEKFRVIVKKAKEKNTLKEAAEVLAYMYDRSLDAFRGHSPPSPLNSYPSYTYFPYPLSTNLGIAPQSHVYGYNFYSIPSTPYLSPDSFRFLSSYGIGGLGRRKGMRYKEGLALPASSRMQFADDADAGMELAEAEESAFSAKDSLGRMDKKNQAPAKKNESQT